MDIVSIIGLVAGCCTTAAVIPQIIKSWRTKEVKDVSPVMFSILVFGVILWIVYGYFRDDIVIMATSGLALFLNSIMIYFMLRYRKKD